LEHIHASRSRKNPRKAQKEAHSDVSKASPSLAVVTALVISVLVVAYVAFQYLRSPAASSLLQAISPAVENSSASQNLSNTSASAIPLPASSPLGLSPVTGATTPPNQLPFPLASAQPTGSPSSTTTYRIANIGQRDFVNLRSGPGENYRPLARIRPAARGIILRGGRAVNGSTKWREISVGGYTGWVNEAYLQPDSLDH
jgi:hypothetical protein